MFWMKRPRLNKQNFMNIIETQDPEFVFFNAHGDEKVIYGDKVSGKEEALVEENKNHEVLNSRLVYARACWASSSLGKACKGGCFVGYTVPFCFFINENWSAKPLNDHTARIFLEPSNLIVSSLLKGNTVKESVDKSLNLSKKNILKLLKEEEEPGATASVMLLWNNMNALDISGNKEMIFE